MAIGFAVGGLTLLLYLGLEVSYLALLASVGL